MSNEPIKWIKTIDPKKCPHCNKDIFIGSQSSPATIVSVSSGGDIQNAKQTVKDRIKDIQFADKKDMEEIITWLDKENTLLDFGDVENMIRQISEEQIKKIQSIKKDK